MGSTSSSFSEKESPACSLQEDRKVFPFDAITPKTAMQLNHCKANSAERAGNWFHSALYQDTPCDWLLKFSVHLYGWLLNQTSWTLSRRTECSYDRQRGGFCTSHHQWVFDKRLKANQTAVVMAKLRQNINQAFYIRYVLVNNETGLRMVFL